MSSSTLARVCGSSGTTSHGWTRAEARPVDLRPLLDERERAADVLDLLARDDAPALTGAGPEAAVVEREAGEAGAREGRPELGRDDLLEPLEAGAEQHGRQRTGGGVGELEEALEADPVGVEGEQLSAHGRHHRSSGRADQTYGGAGRAAWRR